ncbi:MAG: YhdP family protein [Francisellaceae bacterium]
MRRRTFIAWLIVTMLSFILVSTLVIYGLIRLLPFYQASVEDVISRYTHGTVHFSITYSGWDGMNPVLELDNISGSSQNGIVAVDIKKAYVKLDLIRSLWQESFVTREVSIIAPRVTVKPNDNKSGDLWRQLSLTKINHWAGNWSLLVDYLLVQNALKIKAGQLVIEDDGAKPHRFDFYTQWRFKQKNQAEFYLQFAPEPVIPKSSPESRDQKDSRLFVHGVVVKQKEKLQTSLSIEDRQNQLLSLIDQTDIAISAEKLKNGKLEFKMATTDQGLQYLSSKGALSDVNLHFKEAGKLHFQEVSFNLNLFVDGNDLLLNANPINLVTRKHTYSLRSALFSIVDGRLHVNIKQINLQDFSELFAGSNDDDLWSRDTRLTGQLSQIHINIGLSRNYLYDLHLRSHFQDLALQNTNSTLDFSGLSGMLDWQGKKGRILVDSPRFKLGANAFFSAPWPLMSLTMSVNVVLKKDMLEFDMPKMVLKNSHLHFTGLAKIDVPLHHPKGTYLKLRANLTANTITDQYRAFLPKYGITPKLYQWLMQCIYGADEVSATIDIDGLADAIPFYKTAGRFKIEANIKGATISPYIDWGKINDVNGQLSFDNEKFSAHISAATLDGKPIDEASIIIPNIAPHIASDLKVQARALVDEQMINHYFIHSDLESLADRVKNYVDYSGQAYFKVKLDFPIGNPEADHTVAGEIEAEHGVFRLKKIYPIELYNVVGLIKFKDGDITIEHLSAAYGPAMPFEVEGRLNVDDLESAAADLSFKGRMPISLIFPHNIRWLVWPWIHGSLPFSIQLNGGLNQGQMLIHSNLSGLSLHIGSPLEKSSLSLMPSVMRISWQPQRDHTSLDARLNLGDIRFNVTAALSKDKPGQIKAVGDINELNATTIDKALDVYRLMKLSEMGDQNNDFDGCMPVANYYDCYNRHWLASHNLKLDLFIDHLIFADHRFSDINISAAHGENAFVIKGLAENSRFRAMIPYQAAKDIDINIDNFSIPKTRMSDGDSYGNESSIEARLARWLTPSVLRYVPNMHLEVLNSKMATEKIDSLTLQTKNSGAELYGVLKLKNAVTSAVIQGQFSSTLSALFIDLGSHNWGKTLDMFSRRRVLEKGSGTINVKLIWPKMAPRVNQLSGEILLKLKDGMIMSVDSGVAKYIGLFSLESYFSRVLHGQDELSGEGMAFNSLNGQYRIDDGVLISDPSIVIDTSGFALTIMGKIDLVERRIDQVIKYQPHLSGTTALVAGIIGGPVVGFATYLGSKILGNTLFSQSGLISYELSGSWDKPEIKNLD